MYSMRKHVLDNTKAETDDDDEHTSKCALQGRDDLGEDQGTVHCNTNREIHVRASDYMYSLPTLDRDIT